MIDTATARPVKKSMMYYHTTSKDSTLWPSIMKTSLKNCLTIQLIGKIFRTDPSNLESFIFFHTEHWLTENIAHFKERKLTRRQKNSRKHELESLILAPSIVYDDKSLQYIRSSSWLLHILDYFVNKNLKTLLTTGVETRMFRHPACFCDKWWIW